MTLAIVLCGLLAATCVVIAMLLFRGADNLLGEVEPRVTWDVDATPPPIVAPAAVAPASAPPSVSSIRLHLVSNSGRPLGSVEVPANKRRMNFLYRLGKSKELSVFVASQKVSATEWTYRRVGVEKE